MPSTFDAYFISFDPNMYVCQDARAPKRANMYPGDVPLAGAAMRALPRRPIVVQLSTYSVNGPNRQPDVVDSVIPQFARYGFEMACCVHADDAMMSMIFARDISVMSNLEQAFQTWLADRARDSG